MKRFFTLALIIGVTLSFIGCSGETATTGGGNTSSSAEKKEIEFWTVFTGGDGVNMQAMIDAYNASNPEYKVVHRAFEEGDFYQKLPLVIKSGQDVPDLAVNHVDRLKANKESDMYLEMDEYILQNGNIKAENYIPNTWNLGEIDGKRYGIPLDVHTFGTYYNKDLVAKYAPNVLDDNVVTFDEIAEIAPKALEDGITTYAVTWDRPQFLGWYAQLGGKLSENGTDPSFNNDVAVKVYTDFKEAVDKKWATQDGDDPVQLFGQGKLIFLSEGSWLLLRINQMEGLNFGETYAIAYDAKNPVTWASSHHFIMPKKDISPERAKAVMEFINYIGENSLEWAKAGQIPANLKILENEEFKSLPHAFFAETPEFLNISDYKYYGYAVTAIDSVGREMIFGRKDIKTGLDEVVQKVSDDIRNK